MNLIYEKDTDNELPRSDYLLLLGIHLPLVFWSFSGMETTFYTFLLLGSIYFMLKIMPHGEGNRSNYVIWSAVFLALAAMTRPETYVFLPLNLLFIFLYAPSKKRFKFLSYYFFIFLAIFGPFFIWRYNYYGFIFPNTFYNKVDYSSLSLMKYGLQYLTKGLVPHLIILCFILISLFKRRNLYKVGEIYLLSIFITWCLVIIYTGADHFIELRYFVYMIPMLLILSWPGFGLVINSLSAFIRSRLGTEISITREVGSIVICFMCIFSLYFFRTICYTSHVYQSRDWTNVGKWLKTYAKPTDTLATPVIGAIGFYSGLRTYDMLGLTDKFIAHKKVKLGRAFKDHEKFDINYILDKKPVYIFLGTFKLEKQKNLRYCAWLEVYKELYKFDLSRDYTLFSSSFDGTDFTFYKRRN